MTDLSQEPAVQPEVKYLYRIYLLNGLWFDLRTPDVPAQLAIQVRGNGGLVTDIGFTPVSSIVTIQRQPEAGGQGGNVVPLHGGTQTAGQA